MLTTPHQTLNQTSDRAFEPIAGRDNRWLKRFRAALSGDPVRDVVHKTQPTPLPKSAGAPSPDASRPSGEEIIGVEGARLVETALHAGIEVLAVLVADSGMRHWPSLAASVPAGARLLRTSDHLFAQVSDTESPQGIAALVCPPVATFDDLVRGVPLVVVMAGLQDPGNVGALIRASEAFGATGAVACSASGTGTANPYGPKALRASAGSALRLPVLRHMAAPVVLAQLRIAGVQIYATCPAAHAEKSVAGELPKQRPVLAPWDADWRKPVALLLGNEGAGLPAELVRSSDVVVRIPQAAAWDAGAPMDSLNAAVAGAVLLYEAARQRRISPAENA